MVIVLENKIAAKLKKALRLSGYSIVNSNGGELSLCQTGKVDLGGVLAVNFPPCWV